MASDRVLYVDLLLMSRLKKEPSVRGGEKRSEDQSRIKVVTTLLTGHRGLICIYF